MASSHIIQLWSQHVLLGAYTWRALRTSYRGNGQWNSVDLVLTNVIGVSVVGETGRPKGGNDLPVVVVHQQNSTVLDASSFGTPEAFEFFVETLLAPAARGEERLLKLILPQAGGYIARSDIIPLRLQDCALVKRVRSFARPLQCYGSETTPPMVLENFDEDAFSPAIFASAAAGIHVHLAPQVSLEAASSELDQELDNRLSFPWIVAEPARQRTLALVEANASDSEDGIGLYTAAAALGISLVVLDNAGHWLGDPGNAHVCEAFIPTRLTTPPEHDMKDHILVSLRAYGKPIEGIISFADTYWPHVAGAALAMGLPAASPKSFNIATKKYLTSIFAGHQAYQASSPAQALSVAQEHERPYPLIIKPCGGWSSEGVHRIDSHGKLEAAARAVVASRHGPDFVDVNLVLLDGELLFFEVCDDLPKSADVNGPRDGSLATFHELDSVNPSGLPPAEVELLRDTFLGMLLSLGLRNGVMHLEGRVETSAVEYTTRDGVAVLVPRVSASGGRQEAPKAWLIEINPRPLGMTGSQIVESTYGIDYWGLALLSAVGDKTRLRALAQPFVKGPQYTSVMVFIPADFPSACTGVFDSDDICVDLIARRPDLQAFISRCGCLVKRGQHVPHPGTGRNTFLAYFNVFSRNSREEALDIAKQVREAVRYTFV